MGKTSAVRPRPAASGDRRLQPPDYAWSDWRELAGLPPLQPEVVAELLDGGQSFRWIRRAEPDDRAHEAAPAPVPVGDATVWTGVWGNNVCRIQLAGDGTLQWSAPQPIATRVGAALPEYFGLNRGFPDLTDTLPWRSDPHLARCLQAFPGLRILRQPFGETLLCFLCSATKQIVQIKQMVGLLAGRHGAAIVPDRFRLPTWSELAALSEEELLGCQLGFRARYIAQTARLLAEQPGWLEETETLPYAEAKARLVSLPGVGEKVADCVLLFGAGKLEAFPVDVWILRTLARRYGLAGWKPAQLTQFGRAHFGPLAGLAQQYLFGWERREQRSARSAAPHR